MEILERNDKLPPGRVALVQYLIVFGILGLVYGLWQLQVLQAERYSNLAAHNRIRTVPIPAPRGKIYDREGRLIVDNYPSFTVYFQRDATKQWAADLPGIARGLFLNPDDLKARLAKYATAPDYQPIPIKVDVTAQDVAFVAAHQDQFPELETVNPSRRLYPKNGFLAHLIGYVGEPDPKQIASGELRPGALVGKNGVEQIYNDILEGRDGERRVMVDSRGRVVGELSDDPPVAGSDLRLTIDDDIQIAAEAALGDRPGAVVAMDPRNGEVLAMASRPVFDPNLMAPGLLSTKQWNLWANDPQAPLRNKAIQVHVAPGSVFKLVTAVAGLQENVAENLQINCTGTAIFFGRPKSCWIAATGREHGVLGIRAAITQSCDIYFYNLGSDLGIDTIDKYATAMGLGKITGIDLPHEASGLMPSPAWKQARERQIWYRGETLDVAIGQGAIEATPIQLARLVGGIAGGGVFVPPHVAYSGVYANDVSDGRDLVAGSGVAPAAAPPGTVNFPLTDTTVNLVTAGMRGVVNDGGTAASAHLDGIDFGGKTGTAQVVSSQTLKSLSGSRRSYEPNAWFVGVYPVRNPEIVICVLFQQGEEGSLAAQIAARVLQVYARKHPAPPPSAIAEMAHP